jgi:hypothetical protein
MWSAVAQKQSFINNTTLLGGNLKWPESMFKFNLRLNPAKQEMKKQEQEEESI